MDKTQETRCKKEVKEFLFVGAPLLDIAAPCGQDTLDKYDLKLDDCIRETDRQEELFRLLLDSPESQKCAGGSSQNSARVAKWVLGDRGRVSFAGCVGKDQYAVTLLESLQSEGVESVYIPLSEHSTGVCACLLGADGNRSMCSRLGAAQYIAEHHLRNDIILNRVRSAHCIFVEGYVFGHSPDVILALAEMCSDTQIVSFIGLLLTTSSVLSFLTHPKDPLLRWILQVCYFVDVQGIVFHAVLFIVSTFLALGVVSNITPLLVPWLAAAPLFIIAILIQIVLVIVKQPDLSMPVVCFTLMILIFLIYAVMVISAYYKKVTPVTVERYRMYDLPAGQLPRIVVVPQRIAGPFHSERRFPESSTEFLDPGTSEDTEPSPAERWPKLRHAYARFMRVNPGRSTRLQDTRF